MSHSEITKRIHATETRVGRPVGSTRLIAVSKLQPDPAVDSANYRDHSVGGVTQQTVEAHDRGGASLLVRDAVRGRAATPSGAPRTDLSLSAHFFFSSP